MQPFPKRHSLGCIKMQLVLLHLGKNLQTVVFGVVLRLTGLNPNGILIDEAGIETVRTPETLAQCSYQLAVLSGQLLLLASD